MATKLKKNTGKSNKRYTSKKFLLDEKIEIFKEFSATGEKLNVNTVFKGLPVGQWANQIRSMVKLREEGKKDFKISDKQLKELDELGILEKQIEATIDEKLQQIVEWVEKFPDAKPSQVSDAKLILKKYSNTDEQYEKNIKEYEKIQRYYQYAKYRKSNGNLKEEQILKCKEANVGGVFGYSTYIEDLAQKTGQKEKIVDYIINNYGTIENFVRLYKTNKLNKHDFLIASSMTKNTLDIDFDKNSDKYDYLVRSIFEKNEEDNDLIIYSSEEIRKILNELNPKSKKVIEEKMGLNSGKTRTFEDIGEELGTSRENIRVILQNALRKLRKSENANRFCFGTEMASKEEREEASKLKDEIYKSDVLLKNNKMNKENIDFMSNIESIKLIKREEQKTREEIKSEEILKKERKAKEIEENGDIALEDLNLSTRLYNALKRSGVNTLKGITLFTYDEILDIQYLGKNSREELANVLKEYGLEYSPLKILSNQKQYLDNYSRKLMAEIDKRKKELKEYYNPKDK